MKPREFQPVRSARWWSAYFSAIAAIARDDWQANAAVVVRSAEAIADKTDEMIARHAQEYDAAVAARACETRRGAWRDLSFVTKCSLAVGDQPSGYDGCAELLIGCEKCDVAAGKWCHMSDVDNKKSASPQ